MNNVSLEQSTNNCINLAYTLGNDIYTATAITIIALLDNYYSTNIPSFSDPEGLALDVSNKLKKDILGKKVDGNFFEKTENFILDNGVLISSIFAGLTIYKVILDKI